MSFLNELPDGVYPAGGFDTVVLDGAFTNAAAAVACWAAQLAYEGDPAKIRAIARNWGFTATPFVRRFRSFLRVTSTRGLVLESERSVVLAFAGTDPLSLANWVTDLDWHPRSGDLHDGFRAAAEVAWDAATVAASHATGPRGLVIAGHSLGAAIATLTAARLASEGIRAADAVYLFGAPRAGGAEFAAGYAPLAARTFRLVHGHDVVPTLPPPELGFQHVGMYLSCAQYGRFAAPPAAPSDMPAFERTLLAGLKARLASLIAGSGPSDPRAVALGLGFPWLAPAIADHLPSRYLLALDAWPRAQRGAGT